MANGAQSWKMIEGKKSGPQSDVLDLEVRKEQEIIRLEWCYI